MSKFRDYNQKQDIFRTIRPYELLGEDHPARIVDIVVENINLEKACASLRLFRQPPLPALYLY